MALLDSTDGKEEEETVVAEAGVQAGAEADETPADTAADEPVAGAEEGSDRDAEPEAAPEGREEAGDDDDSPLSPDIMDIFDSEDLVEPTIAIPGLQHLTMNEVASETESVLEEMRSRVLS